jgi:two-component system, sensor histidine kinase PdtaS
MHLEQGRKQGALRGARVTVGGKAWERLPLLGERRALAYALAVAASLVAWGVRYLLDPLFPPGFPFVSFLPVVIVTAFLLGRGPGIVAGVLCGLIAWYAFLAPVFSFALDRQTAVALLFYIMVIAIDIALIGWLQQTNGRLAAERERSGELADRTELLFRELQHRVSNNLQMAGAVLALQRRAVADPTAAQALSDAAAKLQLIGQIQRQLYTPSGEQVALDVFVTELVRDLCAAGGKPGVRCGVDAEPGILLSPDAAIPVALILAEAVANALEHGFEDGREGRIAVGVTRRGASIELSVRDDGRGLPPGFALDGATSLGLKIARTLARQLEAEFTLAPDKAGTLMRLVMPAERTLLRFGK